MYIICVLAPRDLSLCTNALTVTTHPIKYKHKPKSKIQEDDTVLYVHPPKDTITGELLGKYRPSMLETKFNLLMGAAPGFVQFLGLSPVSAAEVSISKETDFDMYLQLKSI